VNALRAFWGSTIGKKIVMAVTGLIGVGFVIGHMLGNLQVFLGPTKFNAYAHFLRSLGELLWVVRAVLVAAVALHVVAAVQLSRRRLVARPVGYKRGSQHEVSTLASRTIRWGGALLLVFIVFHILHFTTLSVFRDYSATDVYANVIRGFSSGLPGDQGPGCRPSRARPDHRGGRIHHRADRWRAGREYDPDPQARGRHGNGRRRVHRLWRVCGGVPERVGVTFHGGESDTPRSAAAGAA
jgi:succinate dehydrogenase/fumarate reductase cytochrome b subunit